MRWIALLGLAGAVLLGVALTFPGARASGPEAMKLGKDACQRCHMVISRPGFGGQRLDAKNVITKYDDIGCLLIAMWAAHRETPSAWVEDLETGAPIPLASAALVKDSDQKTPMAYGVVAFAERSRAEAFVVRHGGEQTTLEALLRDTARFNPSKRHEGRLHD